LDYLKHSCRSIFHIISFFLDNMPDSSVKTLLLAIPIRHCVLEILRLAKWPHLRDSLLTWQAGEHRWRGPCRVRWSHRGALLVLISDPSMDASGINGEGYDLLYQ
jgi:hypothetical protein